MIFVILGSRKTQALLSETSEIIVCDKNKVVFLTKIKLKRPLLKPSIHQGYLLKQEVGQFLHERLCDYIWSATEICIIWHNIKMDQGKA